METSTRNHKAALLFLIMCARDVTVEYSNESARERRKPEWVVEHWHPEAARIFATAPPEEQAAHSQLLIVGVSPDERLGAPEFPRVHLIKLEAPDFRPTHFPKGLSVSHIGSGSAVVAYEQAVAEFFKMTSPTLQAATAGPAAWAQMLGSSIGRLVQDDPREGISPHVHIQICTLGGFYTGDNKPAAPELRRRCA